MLCFIHIQNTKDNKEFIFNSSPIDIATSNDEMSACFNYLQKNHPGECLTYIQNPNGTATVTTETMIKNKGWIWTSTERKISTLYHLRKIELFELPPNTDSEEDYETDDGIVSDLPTFTVGTGYSKSVLSPYGIYI
jgi:hypothetical protein